MDVANVARRRGGRKEAKPVRRQQLINATIDSLAKRGYAETTLADIADGAGLSRGIVNFHFESKEKLLVETLRTMADEYSVAWRSALDRAGPTAAHRLWALTAADFSRDVCNRRNIAAWCAFWGEARSRPLYQKLCGSRDRDYQDMLLGLCARLEEEGRYGLDPKQTAIGIDALGEGLWLRLLFMEDRATRKELYACAVAHLVRTFPRHFDSNGVLEGGARD